MYNGVKYITYNNYMKSIFTFYISALRKIHPVEWIVIILAVSIVSFAISSSLNRDQWLTVEFKIEQTGPNPFYTDIYLVPQWFADKVNIGDVQYDNMGQKNFEIIDIKRWGIQSEKTWVKAKVKAKHKSAQNTFTFLYQPLEIGRTIDISLNGAYVKGTVINIDGYSAGRLTQDIIIKARLIDNRTPYSAYTRGVDVWVANSLQKGQTMTGFSKKVLAEILEVEVRNAERTVVTADGRVIQSEDVLKKDVFLTVRLHVSKQHDTYIFLEDIPLRIGMSLPLLFNQTPVYPVITQIL